MAEIANLFLQAQPGLASLTATAVSNVQSAAQAGRTTLTLEVLDVSSWVVGTGTITVTARVAGAGKMDGAAATFSPALSYEILGTTTGAKTAGTTPVTAVGLYEFDITNLECVVTYTRGNGTGTVGVRGSISNTA